MSTVLVAGRLETHALAKLSANSPLVNATPSQYLRWVFAKAAGKSEQDAVTYALGRKPLSELSSGAPNKTVRLTEDVVETVRKQYPGKTDSWIMRYLVALHSGYGEDQAQAIAGVNRPRKRAA